MRLILASVLLLAGCASTQVSSVRSGKFQPKKILVVVGVDNLSQRQYGEAAYTSILSKHGVPSSESWVVLSQEDPTEALVGFDGLLVIIPRVVGTKTIHIPLSTQTLVRNTNRGIVATTSQFGGTTITRPDIRFDIYLYTGSGQTIWYAQSETTGLGGDETLFDSQSKSVVAQLLAEVYAVHIAR